MLKGLPLINILNILNNILNILNRIDNMMVVISTDVWQQRYSTFAK